MKSMTCKKCAGKIRARSEEPPQSLPTAFLRTRMLSRLAPSPDEPQNSHQQGKTHMKSQTLRLCLIAALSCASAAAMAKNPFAGTWKIDYSKSHVTGQTISFTSEADGKVRFIEPDGSY